MARPRKYPPELLDRGARLVFQSNRPIAHVARDLGVPPETLRKYVRQVEADEGARGDRPATAAREEIKQLPRQHLTTSGDEVQRVQTALSVAVDESHAAHKLLLLQG